MHTVKGTPFHTADQGMSRFLTAWEQMDGEIQVRDTKIFLRNFRVYPKIDNFFSIVNKFEQTIPMIRKFVNLNIQTLEFLYKK